MGGGRWVCLARPAQGLWRNLLELVRRSRDLDRPIAVLEVGELLVLVEEVLELGEASLLHSRLYVPPECTSLLLVVGRWYIGLVEC